MTRKDYVLIAKALSEVHAESVAAHTAEGALTVEQVAMRLASRLKEDNPRFDRDRFMRAVRGEPTKQDTSRNRM